MCEQMRDVVGYEGLYEVSSYGRVFSKEKTVPTKNGYTRSYPYKEMKQQVNENGYLTVTLCKQGKRKVIPVHRLVALAFIPNPNGKPQVNHIDEDKKNNMLSNLEWVTNKENHDYGTARQRNVINTSIPVIAIDGDREVVFKSMSDAERAGYARTKGISRCCSGKQKTAGGYQWRYLA